jgi:hypothetical protein
MTRCLVLVGTGLEAERKFLVRRGKDGNSVLERFTRGPNYKFKQERANPLSFNFILFVHSEQLQSLTTSLSSVRS